MIVTTKPSLVHKLEVNHWETDIPILACEILRKQLVAASVLWPELKELSTKFDKLVREHNKKESTT